MLAMTQTGQTVDLLKEKFQDIEFEIIPFSTHGDKVTDKPLTEFGGTGVFVKELEQAIERGEADFAVHSLKDVPGEQPEEFALAAYPEREDPRDIILTRNNISLSDLPDDCVIGTSSPRRLVQIARLKPKAKFRDIRGNIDTRLRKLEDGEFDAIVLAAAGMKRLGKNIDEGSFLPVDTCIPAVGQGIIGLECKADDTPTIELLRSINHPDTETAALAERSFMRTIGGGCKFPLGAHATINGWQLLIKSMIGNHITGELVYMDIEGDLSQPAETGKQLALAIIEEAAKFDINISF